MPLNFLRITTTFVLDSIFTFPGRSKTLQNNEAIFKLGYVESKKSEVWMFNPKLCLGPQKATMEFSFDLTQ